MRPVVVVAVLTEPTRAAGLLEPSERAEGGAAAAVGGAEGGRPRLRRHPASAHDRAALQTTGRRVRRRPARVPPALLLQSAAGVSGSSAGAGVTRQSGQPADLLSLMRQSGEDPCPSCGSLERVI